jgi:hypothetical protein
MVHTRVHTRSQLLSPLSPEADRRPGRDRCGTTTAAREDNAAGALPQTGASSGAETETEPPVSAQTQAAAQTSVDTQAAGPSAETGGGGPWSNWFILPLAAIAVAGAAALARRR